MPHTSTETMVTTGIALSRSMKRALELEAKRDGRSVSGLIRVACGQYLDAVTPGSRKGRSASAALSKINSHA